MPTGSRAAGGDRYGEVIEVDADEHICDRGWIDRADGRVARCPTCTHEPKLTEKDWQRRVTNYATIRGWLVYHPLISRGSAPGWPDLTMVRDGKIIFAELKTDTGRLSRDQTIWLDKLAKVPTIEVHVWRPADWPHVMAALR